MDHGSPSLSSLVRRGIWENKIEGRKLSDDTAAARQLGRLEGLQNKSGSLGSHCIAGGLWLVFAVGSGDCRGRVSPIFAIIQQRDNSAIAMYSVEMSSVSSFLPGYSKSKYPTESLDLVAPAPAHA
jgi:hypothetical protein